MRQVGQLLRIKGVFGTQDNVKIKKAGTERLKVLHDEHLIFWNYVLLYLNDGGKRMFWKFVLCVPDYTAPHHGTQKSLYQRQLEDRKIYKSVTDTDTDPTKKERYK